MAKRAFISSRRMARKANAVAAGALNYSDPTPERMAKAGEAYTIGSGESRVITFTDNPFARAHNRGVITTKQYEAGKKYHTHWFSAGLSDALGSADLNRVFASDVSNFSGMAKTEAQAFHRQRYREACKIVGMTGEAVLTQHICRDMGLAEVGFKLGWGSPREARSAAATAIRIYLDQLCSLWNI